MCEPQIYLLFLGSGFFFFLLFFFFLFYFLLQMHENWKPFATQSSFTSFSNKPCQIEKKKNFVQNEFQRAIKFHMHNWMCKQQNGDDNKWQKERKETKAKEIPPKYVHIMHFVFCTMIMTILGYNYIKSINHMHSLSSYHIFFRFVLFLSLLILSIQFQFLHTFIIRCNDAKQPNNAIFWIQTKNWKGITFCTAFALKIRFCFVLICFVFLSFSLF